MGRQQFDEQREQHQQEVLAAWEFLAAASSRLAQEAGSDDGRPSSF